MADNAKQPPDDSNFVRYGRAVAFMQKLHEALTEDAKKGIQTNADIETVFKRFVPLTRDGVKELQRDLIVAQFTAQSLIQSLAKHG